jgi:hypothetical protein
VFFVSFRDVFPLIAKKETRGLIITKDPVIPADTYVFVELYCSDPDCDCRMVRLSVITESGSSHAEISYGWHDKRYYRGPSNDFEENGLPGPSCSMGIPQGPFAHIFLERFEKLFLSDVNYVNRIKHHYALIKREAQKRDLKKVLSNQLFPQRKIVRLR